MKNKLLGIVTSFAFLVASISSNMILSAEEESKFTRYEAEDALVSNCEIKGVKEGCVVDYGEYSGQGFQNIFLEIGEGLATHSSTLAWKIPWMEEPGRLQSMGSLRVGHD